MGQVIQPTDVRSRLREALDLDLVGPSGGHPLADERLPGWVRPSNWVSDGFSGTTWGAAGTARGCRR